MKRIEINGEFFRMRRGKLVKIPDEWVGAITTSTTIRKRKLDAVAKKRRRKRRSKCRVWHG